ncbi:MAG: hypothetical protein PHW52_00510 [Candidatus Pacebacteria bacterium]|nr:hypothetical protein [Candidatus Paceibacterota bacterium]
MKEDKNEKLESLVMGKIKSGQVKLKSKYVFLAEKLGLGTAVTLSFVLAVLFFNLFLFYVKETDNLQYLSFGREGVFAFLESFPYLIVIAFIIAIILVSYLIRKSDTLYKQSFSHIVVFLIVSITFFGAMLTYTRVAEHIEIESFKNDSPGRFLRPFMTPPDVRDNGLAGVIYTVGDGYLIIKTPKGLRTVDVRKIDEVLLRDVSTGKFIVSIGETSGKEFIANKIRVVRKEDIPSINRTIDRKFNGLDNGQVGDCQKELPSDIMYFGEIEKKCIQICLEEHKCAKDCFHECIRKDRN